MDYLPSWLRTTLRASVVCLGGLGALAAIDVPPAPVRPIYPKLITDDVPVDARVIVAAQSPDDWNFGLSTYDVSVSRTCTSLVTIQAAEDLLHNASLGWFAESIEGSERFSGTFTTGSRRAPPITEPPELSIVDFSYDPDDESQGFAPATMDVEIDSEEILAGETFGRLAIITDTDEENVWCWIAPTPGAMDTEVFFLSVPVLQDTCVALTLESAAGEPGPRSDVACARPQSRGCTCAQAPGRGSFAALFLFPLVLRRRAR